MLVTGWFLTFPPCGLGTVQPKACQGQHQSWHLHPLSAFDQREPSLQHILSLGWAQTPTGKCRPARSLEGGIGHFILTLPSMPKGLGSSSPVQGPNFIPHPEKSLLEIPSLFKTVANRH